VEANVTDAPTSAELLGRLAHEMQHPPFHDFLRPVAKSVDAGSGAITVTLAFRPEFGRSAASPGIHGGVLASLIDLAGHAAVAVRIGRTAPTIDLRIDYLRAAGEVDLTATAHIVRAGRTVAIVDVKVTDSQERLIAIGRGAFSTAAGYQQLT
jgi:uncharacterized protein (TIGR00369 family)